MRLDTSSLENQQHMRRGFSIEVTYMKCGNCESAISHFSIAPKCTLAQLLLLEISAIDISWSYFTSNKQKAWPCNFSILSHKNSVPLYNDFQNLVMMEKGLLAWNGFLSSTTVFSYQSSSIPTYVLHIKVSE